MRIVSARLLEPPCESGLFPQYGINLFFGCVQSMGLRLIYPTEIIPGVAVNFIGLLANPPMVGLLALPNLFFAGHHSVWDMTDALGSLLP